MCRENPRRPAARGVRPRQTLPSRVRPHDRSPPGVHAPRNRAPAPLPSIPAGRCSPPCGPDRSPPGLSDPRNRVPRQRRPSSPAAVLPHAAPRSVSDRRQRPAQQSPARQRRPSPPAAVLPHAAPDRSPPGVNDPRNRAPRQRRPSSPAAVLPRAAPDSVSDRRQRPAQQSPAPAPSVLTSRCSPARGPPIRSPTGVNAPRNRAPAPLPSIPARRCSPASGLRRLRRLPIDDSVSYHRLRAPKQSVQKYDQDSGGERRRPRKARHPRSLRHGHPLLAVR